MRSEIPLAYSKYGVTIMDKRAAENSFMDSFYSNTELARESLPHTEGCGSVSVPSEPYDNRGNRHRKGPGGSLSTMQRSPCVTNPLYVINCSLISDKSWDFITKHYNSPFTDNGNTIYISNLDSLQSPSREQLLSIILDTNMHVRNHLIFSCTQTAGAPPHVVFEYTNALGCILVPIKPLREQRRDIISSAGLYINTLNQELGRQVVGVDDEAAALLEQYEYPLQQNPVQAGY